MTTTTAKRSTSAKAEPAEQPSAAEANAANSKGEAKLLTSESIGEAAGIVWQCLSDDGPQSLAKLKKGVDAPADVVLAAIGWLAREGKLSFETNSKAVTISLGN